jgi:hypothetical protein
MEFLNFLLAIAALLIPLLFAWVVVNRLANKHSPKHVKKSR